MAREKQKQLVVAFSTTADAMALEKACKGSGIPGKLIPIPRKLSAGCGIAFTCEVCLERDIEDLIKSKKIDVSQICEMYI